MNESSTNRLRRHEIMNDELSKIRKSMEIIQEHLNRIAEQDF